MRLIAIAFLTCQISIAGAQIKINNPYQNKDKTYIPDENEPAETNKPVPSGQPVVPGGTEQEQAIGRVVYDLFKAMNESDPNKIRGLFMPQGRLTGTDANGTVNTLSVEDFAKMIMQNPKGSLEERVTSLEIRIDDNLATAWVEYDFYFNNKLNHCGVDAFQFVKTGNTWKIIQISDTKRTNCVAGGKAGALHQVLDSWHQAASRSDLKGYFDQIAPDGIYLGTDPGERWTREEFLKFAKPFFDKGSGWKFTPRNREISISENAEFAWFDELLDTWMGVCRGSGVMVRGSGGLWKIKQYNLAILVPNNLVQDYLKLVQSKK